jgi:carbamoyl-phosphate synthase large subunit
VQIRRTTLSLGIPYFTTISGALAAAHAIEAARLGGQVLAAVSLQEYHRRPRYAPDQARTYEGFRPR